MKIIYVAMVAIVLLGTQLWGAISDGLVANWRMDECYWLGGGVESSVKDNTAHGYDASVYNGANTVKDPHIINNSGKFNLVSNTENQHIRVNDDTVGDTDGNLSVSFWVQLSEDIPKNDWTIFVVKTVTYNWSDGWGFGEYNGDLRFFIDQWNATNQYINTPIPKTSDGWVHFVGTYDGTMMHLYRNGEEEGNTTISGLTVDGENPVSIGWNGDSRCHSLQGYIDEVKIWNRALSEAEVREIYSNEKSGLNYDGTTRKPVECNTTIAANSWELVGIPIDLRSDPKSVKDTFQGMSGTYGDDWRVYRRDYSDSNNSSWYTYLDDPNDDSAIEFGKAYWLGNKQSEQTWDVNGTVVNYNYSGSDCPANQCVEIDLKSVTHNFATDGDDGTGPYRYNMTGFIGNSSVQWADCRLIIDGTAYTPSAAETAGYASKQIWQYNPGSGTNSNGYTTCDDSLTTCMLEPFKGFWIELRGPTKGKTVKLLIPKE